MSDQSKLTHQDYADLGIVDGEFVMGPEERIQHSLANPESPRALKPARIERVTTARIRYSISEFVADNIDKVQDCFDRVSRENPKIAIELFMEMAQFAMPKLKAVAVSIDDQSGNSARRLTFEQLQKLVAEESDGKVVSEQ